MEILARELKTEQKEVTKNGGKSYLLIDRIKEDEKND